MCAILKKIIQNLNPKCSKNVQNFLKYNTNRGGFRGLPLLPMQHPEMAHINFQS